MKNTDILTGRIVQRVLNAAARDADEVNVCHGIGNYDNINLERLIENLFEFFPEGKIKFKKLQFGYEMNISVCFRKKTRT